MTPGPDPEDSRQIKSRGKHTAIPRPFLKWVGGKGQLLPTLKLLLPQNFGRYHEPFIGGGALFFALKPPKAALSDLNEELIHCYRLIRDDVEAVIDELASHVYEKDHYYAVRAWNPAELSAVARAARTIYLNKAGFNGLYRVNSRGLFNVPFGRHSNPKICDDVNLRACSQILAGIALGCKPFDHVLETARPGDFVYFDPPYIPVSRTSNFTAYGRDGFDMAGQEQLATVFDELARRGVFAMLSNSDVPWIHERFRDHKVQSIRALRLVNSNSTGRGAVSELVVTNY